MQKSGDYSHFPEVDNISDCSKATHLTDTRHWVGVYSFLQSWSQSPLSGANCTCFGNTEIQMIPHS